MMRLLILKKGAILMMKYCGYILKWLDQLLQQRVGRIVLSDYGKGMITEQLAQTIIKKGKEYDVPVLIDPGQSVPAHHTLSLFL